MKQLLSILRRRAQVTWLGWAFGIVCLILIPITNHVTLVDSMATMRFTAMDSRDTFYLTSASTFETSQKIRAEISRLAAAAMFNRSPTGPDNPEGIDRLFGVDSTKQLMDEISKDAETFRAQSIHQKVETGQPHEMSINEGTALVSMPCQIVRAEMFNQRVQNETKKLTLFFKIRLNEQMADNGKYPMVVTHYECAYE